MIRPIFFAVGVLLGVFLQESGAMCECSWDEGNSWQPYVSHIFDGNEKECKEQGPNAYASRPTKCRLNQKTSGSALCVCTFNGGSSWQPHPSDVEESEKSIYNRNSDWCEWRGPFRWRFPANSCRIRRPGME